MKKRILSLLLAVVLCLSLLPTAALAEEGTGVVAEVTIDGEVRSYATLQEAFDAVGSSIDSVIKLLADITLENGLTIRGGVFTLDLNGKTVNHSDADVNAVSMTGGIVTLTDHGTGSGTIGQKFVVNGGTLNMSGGKIAGSLVLGNPAGQISLSGGSFDSIRIDTPAEEKRGLADLLAEGYAFQKNGELQYLQSLTAESTIENVAVVKCTHPYISIGECPYCGSTVEMEEIKSITAVGDGTGNWLNGVSWWPDNASNHMTETSTGSGVYEITYTGVAAGNYKVKFVANDEWMPAWGAEFEAETAPLEGDATYSGSPIPFSVAKDNSTVKLVLDLSKLDRATGAGATYSITITAYTPSIQLGASAIKGWSADDGYDYIYLGNWKDNPVKWRVLSANGDTAKSYQGGAGNTSTKSNALFMLSEDVLEQTQFGGSGNKKWEGSTAESWCDGFKTGALTAEEQLAVFTTVSKSGANGAKYNNIVFDNKNSSLLRSTGNKVFFLSVIEANDSAYGFSNNDARKATGGAWWLLSRTTKGYGYFGTVSSDGAFQSTAANSSAGARPALNLDKRQVLFTSAADNSAHQDGLVTPTSYDGHEFKLTLKDANSFEDGTKIVGGRTTLNNQYQDASITIQHKALNEISGDYNNVTAALTDSAGTLLYYGSVDRDTEAMRTVVTLPNGLPDGKYTLSLYGEDWNDEYKSDYATGTPFTVEITIHDGADGPDLTPREQDGLLTIDKITGYDAKWGYNKLYFGKFGADPILWRVLSVSGNATGDTDSLNQDDTAVSNEDAMFLLSEYLLGQDDSEYDGIVFNKNGTAYNGSNAQVWCGELLTGFTENEQNVVLATVKSDAASTNDGGLQFPAVENILNGDKVFLPSVEEMKSTDYGFSSENDLIAYHDGSTAGDWWMRSAGTGASIADAEYNTNRTEYKIYAKLANEHSYARPAFNLSKNDVLFVCTADGVKTGTVGTLTAIESNLSSEWKLTLLDESRDFSVTETEVEKFAGGTLTLHYTGAQTGENEYISAIFYDADGKAAYYGRLKNLTAETDAEGSVELTVPAGLGEDEYKLVLFNEQYNGAKQTDYASRFCTVTLTVDNTAPELSDFAVSRASESTASVTFSASERGSYYYVVSDSETVPSIDTTGDGSVMSAGEQTLELDNVPAGKSYLHIVAKDVAGNFCKVQTIQILGFLPAPTNADWDDAVLGKASWDAVEYASGYSIQLYKDGTALGSAETVTETNYTFTIPEPPAEDSDDSTTTMPTLPDNAITEAGAYSFRVTALGDGTDYSSSVAAESARHLSSITVEENENGTVTASARYAVSGTEVTLTSEPNSGYRFSKWSLTPELTVTDNKFVMPEEAVTVSAVFTRRSTGGSASTYPITVKDSKNGSASSSHKSASSGTTVTITVTPDKGYTLETLTVTDKNGKEIKLTEKNGKYTFTMPASKVEVNAIFVKEVETSPFGDVSTSAYYYKAVKWAQKKGITGGIGNGLFGPNQPCTRAQIVTFLWRAAGSPVVNYAMNMSDVPEGSYYAEAVRWALSEGITTGTTENTFSPDSECTRAQAVAFLFRYAASEAVTLQELVSGFSDADSVPGYALPAMNWALAEEIVQGDGSKLMPNDSCTRAQIVTFLFRAYQGK